MSALKAFRKVNVQKGHKSIPCPTKMIIMNSILKGMFSSIFMVFCKNTIFSADGSSNKKLKTSVEGKKRGDNYTFQVKSET